MEAAETKEIEPTKMGTARKNSAPLGALSTIALIALWPLVVLGQLFVAVVLSRGDKSSPRIGAKGWIMLLLLLLGVGFLAQMCGVHENYRMPYPDF